MTGGTRSRSTDPFRTCRCVRPFKAVHESAYVMQTLDRSTVYAAQTPQAFRGDVLRRAHARGRVRGHRRRRCWSRCREAPSCRARRPDEPEAHRPGGPRCRRASARRTTGGRANTSVGAWWLSVPIGYGFDIHPFTEDPGRRLVLGGVVIEGIRGLAGHSDADPVADALADAVLGVVGLGDLGRLFPDTDPVWSGADSLALLRESCGSFRRAGSPGQRGLHHRCRPPRLAPHRQLWSCAWARSLARRYRSRRHGPRASAPSAGSKASPVWPLSCWRRRDPAPRSGRPRNGGGRGGSRGESRGGGSAARSPALSELGGDRVEGRRALIELLRRPAARRRRSSGHAARPLATAGRDRGPWRRACGSLSRR